MHTRTWHVEINIFEEDDHTNAVAVLKTDAGAELQHSGRARRNPDDVDIPEIGDELAACRALAALSHELLDATIMDVAQNVGKESVRLDR